ncbi:MAG: protein-L-isoaspartate(D-aspartate) O-methyltransferase [Solirubrobacterales bacterium]|nr:protein-L-isoaspartate(D-aspartate) O-methyltransferase [Solirubrobacterales bacterium]
MNRDELIEEVCAVVRDRRVLEAIREVPREAFVPPDLRRWAWQNEPLPIGRGQTISQPLVVARMCELLDLDGDEVILDVGGGSGYHAAVLATLGRRVISVEQHEDLALGARESLVAAGIENVEVVVGDGSLGWAAEAPYDAINVAAAAEREVPPALIAQLADDGRLIAPVGRNQRLTLIRREGELVRAELLEPVRFVPLSEHHRQRD